MRSRESAHCSTWKQSALELSRWLVYIILLLVVTACSGNAKNTPTAPRPTDTATPALTETAVARLKTEAEATIVAARSTIEAARITPSPFQVGTPLSPLPTNVSLPSQPPTAAVSQEGGLSSALRSSRIQWSKPQRIPLPMGVQVWWPVLAADGKDNVHLAWANDTVQPWPVQYARWSDNQWSASETISAGSISCDSPSIVADANGRVSVAWLTRAGSTGIWLRRWQGGWQPPEEIGTTTAKAIELALATDGSVHAVWSFADRVIYRGGNSKAAAVPGLLGGIAAVAVDTTGIVFVASSQNDLKIVERSLNGAWSSPQTVWTGSGQPSLAADRKGRVHLSWCSDQQLYYAVHTAGSWSQPQLLATVGSDICEGFGVGLAVDGAGNLHLAVGLDKAGAAYIGQENGAWNQLQVIYAERTGKADIAIDTQGRIHIVLWPGAIHLIGSLGS